MFVVVVFGVFVDVGGFFFGIEFVEELIIEGVDFKI